MVFALARLSYRGKQENAKELDIFTKFIHFDIERNFLIWTSEKIVIRGPASQTCPKVRARPCHELLKCYSVRSPSRHVVPHDVKNSHKHIGTFPEEKDILRSER